MKEGTAEGSSQGLSFASVLAPSARLYRANLKQLGLIFAVVALTISLLALVGLAGFGRADLFVAFLAQIVLPVIVGGFAMAVASLILDEHRQARTISLRDALARAWSVKREVIIGGLFASMAAVWAVILLAQFGFILMPLFFGPPILIQVIALERMSLRPARARTRELMAGLTGRVVLYLLVIALAIGLLGTAALSAFIAVANDGASDAVLAAIFSVVQVLIAALLLPFLASSFYVSYRALIEAKEAA